MIFNNKTYCCYCGKWLVWPLIQTTEHLIPVSKGGNNTLYNKRPCCSKCNSWRGDKSLRYWLDEVVILINENKPNPPHYHIHDLKILEENIKYWMFYIETAGKKLLR